MDDKSFGKPVTKSFSHINSQQTPEILISFLDFSLKIYTYLN